MNKRYIYQQVIKDLSSKMVFIGGPRQVGKTTLSESICPENMSYLNWDIASHRKKILAHEFSSTAGLWIFDEIHKYKSWKNYLKGVYDEFKKQKQILVTGSARLDLFRKAGDSLQGRYHFLRLLPLSVAELGITTQANFHDLLSLGGFPEPFFAGSEVEAKRWSNEYRSRLIRDEIRDVENISDIGNMELAMLRMPELVGSPLSVNGLREDLQIDYRKMARWVQIFEKFYAIFLLPPLGSAKIKAVKKEKKHYHLDWSLVESESARFENLVAVHLLKWVNFEEDTKGRLLELRYFRDIEKREVDFVVTEKGKPILFVECKLSDDEIDNGLKYLRGKFPDVPAFQISAKGTKDYLSKNNIRVCPALMFLKDLI